LLQDYDGQSPRLPLRTIRAFRRIEIASAAKPKSLLRALAQIEPVLMKLIP
jgi:hypothetical protein